MESLFFFWGQEDFLINSEIKKIKDKFIDKTFETMAYKKLYDPKFEDVINSIRALPMMFGNIMHVIDVNNFFLSENDNKVDDWDLKQFEDALLNKSEKNIIVLRLIIPKDSKKKVDTRKKIYKITSKYAKEKNFPLYKEFDKTLQPVIVELGKKHGLSINREVSAKIIEQIGSSLGIINSEFEKLAMTLYPKTEPTVADIENICTKKDDVFIILEAVFQKNKDKALFELKKVLQKSTIPEVMAAIQYSLRNYSIIKSCYPVIGKIGLSQKLHIHEFVIEKNYKAMDKINLQSLLKLKQSLLKTEYAIKSGDCINPEIALEMAIMEVEYV